MQFVSNKGMNFIDRGDANAIDFTAGDFTIDASWYDLDLSSIVPNGAKAVLLRCYTTLASGVFFMTFRTKGNVNEINVAGIGETDIGGLQSNDLIVFCNVNRIIQYMGFKTGVAWFNVTIGGWWI